MELVIRPLQEKDNPILAKIIREVLTEYKANKPGTVFTDPTTDNLFELFQTPGSCYWVVEENGNILGGSGLFPTEGLPDTCIELVKLYLSKESRGKGLGKMLMDQCIQKAKELGYNQVYLESLPELNTAVKLYENMGFVHLNEPLGASGHFACNLWMLKNI